MSKEQLNEQLSNVVNNDKISNTLFNLYFRWQDEKEYEDIRDYAKVLFGVIQKEFPNAKLIFYKAFKRPFGIEFVMNGQFIRIWAKVKGRAICCCGKYEVTSNIK